jgi:hypothetical protein
MTPPRVITSHRSLDDCVTVRFDRQIGKRLERARRGNCPKCAFLAGRGKRSIRTTPRAPEVQENLRHAGCLDQHSTAQRLGVSQGFISKIENGNVTLSSITLKVFKSAFPDQWEWILTGAQNTEKSE